MDPLGEAFCLIMSFYFSFKNGWIQSLMNPNRSYLFVGPLFLLLLMLLSAPVAAEGKPFKVAIVGDTGIGDRVFHPGFVGVMESIKSHQPDLLLHLGDFIYQSKKFPQTCDVTFLDELKTTLVDPFEDRMFVAGDNDLPPHLKKPKASACWNAIDPLDTPFDPPSATDPQPGPFEGTRIVGNTLFAVVNSYPWSDPAPWLKPRVEQARKNNLWVIVAMHEPALTTAWYLERRDTVLTQINRLQPDLVFSGNQHSYERFHALGVPLSNGIIPAVKPDGGSYPRGRGALHIVTGGGGATFKPFADMVGNSRKTAPQEVFDVLAKRGLLNHFVLLEISQEKLMGKVVQICPDYDPETQNPRWRSHKRMWETIRLDCDSRETGFYIFDQFEIR